jgi:hypothetical protein
MEVGLLRWTCRESMWPGTASEEMLLQVQPVGIVAQAEGKALTWPEVNGWFEQCGERDRAHTRPFSR